MKDQGSFRASPSIPGGDDGTGAAILRLIEEKEAMRERAVIAETELALWRSGKITRETVDGRAVIMHHPDDPNAEVRDSETGEVLFPARKAPFSLIAGGLAAPLDEREGSK